MNKACKYFDITDDLFYTLISLEDKVIVDALCKRFGKNFDQVLSLKNFQLTYNLIEEIFKIDVLYIKKLDNNGLSEREYKTNFIERFKYVFDLTNEELISLSDELPKRSRNAFKYTFGIERNKINIEDLANMLDCSENDIIFSLKDAISTIKRKLNNNSKSQKNAPISLTVYLKNKGYDLETFIASSKYYDDETLTCLKKLYGPKFMTTRNSYNIISDKENEIVLKALDNIDENIKKLKENVELKKHEKNNLRKYYQKMGFNDEEIDDAYNSLTEEEKQTMHLLYDDEFNEMKVNLNYKTLIKINDVTKSKTSGMLHYLLKKKLELINKSMISDLFLYYENIGYDHEHILSVINDLDEGKIRLLHIKYDNEFKLLKNVFISDQTKEKIDIVIDKLTKMMKNKTINKKPEITEIKHPSKTRTKIVNLYIYFLNRGYTRDEIKEAINELTQEQRDFIFTYYELESLDLIDSSYKSDSALISKMNTILIYTIPTKIISKRIDAGIDVTNLKMSNKAKKFMENYMRTKHKDPKIINLFKNFENKGFTHDEIKDILNDLNDEQKTFIFTYFDKESLDLIDSSYKSDNQKKSKMDNLFNVTIPMMMIRKRMDESISLDDLALNKLHKRYIEVYQKKLEKKQNHTKSSWERLENLYDYYEYLGYTHLDVDNAIKVLDKKYKEIIYTYYDEELNIKDKKESKPRNLRYSISHIIPLIILKSKVDGCISISEIKKTERLEKAINDYINGKYYMINNLYTFFENYGYKHDEITEAFDNLNENQKDVIFTYFDSSLKLIDSSYRKDKSTRAKIQNLLHGTIQIQMIRNRINKDISIDDLIINKKVYDAIKNYQKERKRKRKCNNLFEILGKYGYNHDEIENAINMLTKSQKEYLFTYFDSSLNLINFSYKEETNQQTRFSNFIHVTIPALMLRRRVDAGISISEIKMNKQLDDMINRYIDKQNNSILGYNPRYEITNLYTYFEHYGYNHDEITESLKSLNQEQKEILFKYFDSSSLELIDLSYKNDKHVNNKIHHLLNNLLQISMIKTRINECISIDDLKLNKRVLEVAQKYQQNQKTAHKKAIINLFTFFENYGYNHDEIKEVINNLNEEQSNFIFTYFASSSLELIDPSYRNDSHKKAKLSNLLHVTIPMMMLRKRIDECISLDDLIINKNQAKYIETYQNKKYVRSINDKKQCVNLYQYYQKYHYQNEEVDIAIEKLDKKQKELIFTYYDSKTYELIDSSFNKDKKLYSRIKSILYVTIQKNMIKRRIDNNISINDLLLSDTLINIANNYINKKEKNKDNSFYEYIDNLKELNIINEELLDYLDLSDKEKFYLRFIFIWNKENMFTIEEMSNIMNIDALVFNKELYLSIKKLVELLNNKFKYKKTLN